MKEITKYLILLLLSANLYGQPTLERKTITEALNYTGDKSAVKKLIITDSIAGSDYSDGSEWRLFRTLYEVFENIEAVEIWTEQDIPDWHIVNYDDYPRNYSLFCVFDSVNKTHFASNWLKEFSAPNVKYIGNSAFDNCENLIYVNFPNVYKIGGAVFFNCYSLKTINFPKVREIVDIAFENCHSLNSINFPFIESIGHHVFLRCINLRSVSFATEITELTEIKFGMNVFGNELYASIDIGPILTPNIDLVLGDKVFPLPDTILNIWQTTNYMEKQIDYIWNSVKIKYVGIKEEIQEKNIYCIGNNTYKIENMNCTLELYDIMGRLVGNYTEQHLDLNCLKKGCYFFRIPNNKNYTIKKIIIN